MLEENEYDSDYEPNDDYINFENRNSVSSSGVKMTEDKEIGEKGLESKPRTQVPSPPIFSPMDSPKTPPNVSSPKADVQNRKDVLRLLSRRVSDCAMANSLPLSPHMNNDYSISSAESDSEMVVF